MRFIVRNHRDRKKLTLTAAHSDKVTKSVTLTLSGARVLELSDKICQTYEDSLREYVDAGALIPARESASSE